MNNIIDKSYCINLDIDMERYNSTKIQFEKHNLEVERFSGIDGRNIKLSDYPNIIKKDSLLFQNKKGSCGCYISHILLWDKILKDNDSEIILILEDDIIIDNNFENKFLKYYKDVPNDWDLLYLGTGKQLGKNINKNIMKPKIGSFTGYNNGTFGYIIKKTSIEKIKKLILPIKNKTIDFVIRNNFKNIKAYFFINKIILHNYNFIPTKKNIDKNKNIGN